MLAAQTTTMGARPAFMGMRVTSINVQRSQGQGRVSMRIRAEDEAEKQSAAKASPAALRYVACFTAEGGGHVVGTGNGEFLAVFAVGFGLAIAHCGFHRYWRRSCGVAIGQSVTGGGTREFRAHWLTGSLLVHTRAGRSLPRRRPSRERSTG